MKLPLQITFRDFDHSDSIESAIKEKARKLEQFSDQITSCRVIIEAHHKHHHKGNLFQVRIDITVPGEEIVVSREPHNDHSHEDPYVTLRDAFDAARRQLDDYQNISKHQVKQHSR